jgi:hypothetical protein
MIVAPSRRHTLALRRQLLSRRTLIVNNNSYLRPSQALLKGRNNVTPLSVTPLVGITNDQLVQRNSLNIPNSSTKRFHSNVNDIKTRKILERNNAGNTTKKTLYDPSRETENCGVGLIASLKSIPSRDIVLRADEMLVRMAHRGGCGCDPASGDGSGEFVCVCMSVLFL